MADLMTHVLVAYTIAALLSLKYDWMTSPYTTAVMTGAVLPDLTRINLILDSALIENYLGIPFSWTPLHTTGGVLIVILIITVFIPKNLSKRVFLLLVLGAVSHLVLDLLLINASGRSYAVLWPLTHYHPPTPGLYLSTDIFPVFVAGAAALIAYKIKKDRD